MISMYIYQLSSSRELDRPTPLTGMGLLRERKDNV